MLNPLTNNFNKLTNSVSRQVFDILMQLENS